MKKKRKTILSAVLLCAVLAGCGGKLPGTEEAQILGEEIGCEDPIRTAELYEGIYVRAVREGGTGPELVRQIVRRLGENGYAAVDQGNQMDMVNADQVRAFVQKAGNREKAELTVVCVMESGGFIQYDLRSEGGSVWVVRSRVEWEDGVPAVRAREEYPAHTWNFLEGYLFFEQYHMPGYDGASGHTAIRVEPLSEVCREYNRKYLLPVGYALNNLFTCDWSEEDYGDLNFYDLYEIFLRMKEGERVSGTGLQEGVTYEIPRGEFEAVFETYFCIGSEELRQGTVYREEEETYQYRTRGMFDCAPTPYVPYPEVTGYEKNGDGTITLRVNAVWPEESLARAFCHEVVVRPLADGGFQYVSNHVIPSEKNVEITWYTDRLSEEEWQEAYGPSLEEKKEADFSPEERQRLQEDALRMALTCDDLYEDVEFEEVGTDYSYVKAFSKERRQAVVERLGKYGAVSVSDQINMENYTEVEDFYAAYQEGREGMVTVFYVWQDGSMTARTFVYRDGELGTYYVGIRWKKGGIPVISGVGTEGLSEMRLTEKGYLIYAFDQVVPHGNLREFFRVKPWSEECRELTETYLSGLSYVNYNLLVTDWDEENVEEILMPCMFEDIYRIYTGEQLKPEGGRIPAEVYERVMTACFPVTAEQVKRCCGYDADSDSYEYEKIFPTQYPPFGEVVDRTYHEDGTITLYVDAVWPDYGSDRAFTNRIVVSPSADGSFRYLSNSIEKVELDIPEVE